MSNSIEIYGSTILLPDTPEVDEIHGFDFIKRQQKWVKKELPLFFSKVEFNKGGDLLLTPEQKIYAKEEVKRCKEGFFIFINGVIKWLPPKYYFYLQYYILEDGFAPEFREADRKYFLFLYHWEKVDWALGMVRTKKRRAGASSQACSNLLYEAIFYKNSNCGLISKTKEDSKDTFTEMVTAAYRQLPVFLKPKQINKEDTVSELLFAYKSQNVKEGTTETIKSDDGNRSKINFRAPVLNAYDRSRQSRILVDEGAKFPKETPTSQLLAIISKTLVKGVKKVGWVDMPSTVNEMTKLGGAEFKKIWNCADQFKRRPTINRLVRLFQPAYEAYEGFIDEFGESVIDTPTDEQYNYLVGKWVKIDESGETISELSSEDIKMGAKWYVQVKRRQGLDGISLEEEIRMNPCTEDEAFLSAVSDCAFNSLNINKRIKQLEENPPIIRSIIFYRNEETQKVHWRDITESEKHFHWRIRWFPKSDKINLVKFDGRTRLPGNPQDGCIAVDSYSNSMGGRKYGSKASAWIGRKYDILDPENTGRPIGLLFGRPQEKDMLHNQVLLAGEYFGYQIYYEHTADDYDGYFKDRGKRGYLGKYPISLIDPTKRKEDADRHRGTPITPFSLTKQLDNGISFFENHCEWIDYIELLENALIFDPYDRTSYDMVVSFLILISCLMETTYVPTKRKEPLIKTYGKENLSVA